MDAAARSSLEPQLLKSQSGTLKGCGAPGWTMVPPPVRKLDPKANHNEAGCYPNPNLQGRAGTRGELGHRLE